MYFIWSPHFSGHRLVVPLGATCSASHLYVETSDPFRTSAPARNVTPAVDRVAARVRHPYEPICPYAWCTVTIPYWVHVVRWPSWRRSVWQWTPSPTTTPSLGSATPDAPCLVKNHESCCKPAHREDFWD